MNCLEELESNQQEKQLLQRLQLKKQKLLQELEDLKKQTFPLQAVHQDVNTVEQGDCQTLTEICDSYKILGVSIQSMSGDIVLRFDPVYQNQLSATETYCVQLLRKTAGFVLGQHNLPVWMPLSSLEKDLAESIQLFVSSVRDLLYAYVQRRSSLQMAQDEFEGDLKSPVEVDLPVTYTKLQCKASESICVDITLQYELRRSQPSSVNIEINVDDTSTVSKHKQQQMVFKWKEEFLKSNISAGLAQIVNSKC